MISIYDNDLPDTITVDGADYLIRTDFREWIKFELLMLDPDIPPGIKSELIKDIVFQESPPQDYDSGGFILWFYRCGKDSQSTSKGSRSIKKAGHIYSFEYDDLYIYAAFWEQYGIDLSSIPYMHWWRFKALFLGLHDTKFNSIMEYRSTEITSSMSQERKKQIKIMQDLYRLPKSISEEQKILEAKRIMEEYKKA